MLLKRKELELKVGCWVTYLSEMTETHTSERITNVKRFIIFFYAEYCFFFKDLEMFF